MPVDDLVDTTDDLLGLLEESQTSTAPERGTKAFDHTYLRAIEASSLDAARRQSLLEQLADHVRRFGGQVRETISNGNCFFHALAIICPTIFPDMHIAHIKVAQYMRTDWGAIESQMGVSWDETAIAHADRMERDRVFAELPAVVAAAQLLGGLHVVSPFGAQLYGAQIGSNPLAVAWDGQGHYEAIVTPAPAATAPVPAAVALSVAPAIPSSWLDPAAVARSVAPASTSHTQPESNEILAAAPVTPGSTPLAAAPATPEGAAEKSCWVHLPNCNRIYHHVRRVYDSVSRLP